MRHVILLMLLSAATGCVHTETPAVNFADLSKVDFSKVDSFKTGVACSTSILGFIGPFGRARLMEAVKAGKMGKVLTVEYEYNFYFLFSRFCIRVYGEEIVASAASPVVKP